MSGQADDAATAARSADGPGAHAALMLERTQVLSHLQHACQPARRAMLLDELMRLDARLREVTDAPPLSFDSGA